MSTTRPTERRIEDRRKQWRGGSPLNRGAWTTRDLAVRVGVHAKTIRQYLDAGEIFGYRIGKRAGVGEWRVPHPEALRFLRQVLGRVEVCTCGDLVSHCTGNCQRAMQCTGEPVEPSTPIS